jgi:hypothetical protein
MEREYIPMLHKKTFGDALVEYSTSNTKFEGRYKPGGTITAALGPLTHRVVNSGSDGTCRGRWSYVTYVGKGEEAYLYHSIHSL